MSESVYLVSLGCPKNLVDSEIMLGSLMEKDYQVVERPEDAQVIVVNTCSFIQSATQESVDTILELARHKEGGKCSTLVVTGCLAQRHSQSLLSELPEVDYFVGTGEYPRLTQILTERPSQRTFVGVPTYLHDERTPRVNSQKPWTAYLKISEGCDHRCSFCIIPTLRGDLRSRPIEGLVAEARALAEQGVKELNLISQDTNSYGYDLAGRHGRTQLAKLLRELGKVEGLEWIRPLYLYPKRFPEELIRVLADEPKVVKYIDIPLQHISTRLLKRMNRGVGGDHCRQLVHRLREMIPGVTIRTTFIVGFPGETEEEYQELVDFVQEMKFERLGVFTWSPEEGTPAASLDGQLPMKVKRARQRHLMAVQKKISKAWYKDLVGTVQPVLVEGRSEETDLLLQGRLASQAPEIDGHVLINAGQAQVGSIMPVRMTRALDYDIIGEIVEDSTWQAGISV